MPPTRGSPQVAVGSIFPFTNCGCFWVPGSFDPRSNRYISNEFSSPERLTFFIIFHLLGVIILKVFQRVIISIGSQSRSLFSAGEKNNSKLFGEFLTFEKLHLKFVKICSEVTKTHAGTWKDCSYGHSDALPLRGR